MDPLIGAALISTVGGGILSGFGQSSANKQNLKIAREQMAFQERMSNTAHRREVRDLQAAGLNPLLSAGAGASAPSGASATMGNVGAAVARDISRAPEVIMSLQQQRANIDQTHAQEAYIKAQEKSVELQNELHQLTINWYKNNPQFAPNVSGGIYTGPGITQTAEKLKHDYNVLKGRFQNWLSEKEQSVNTYLRNRGGAFGRWLAGDNKGSNK